MSRPQVHRPARRSALLGLLAVVCLPAATGAPASGPLLHAGPMLAYVDLREAAVWVQTERAADVQLRYRATGSPGARLTEAIHTQPGAEFVATFVLSGLAPGTSYDYELYLDGELTAPPYTLGFKTQPLWQWRTPAPDFTAAFGSCAYINDPAYDRPGKGFGSDYSIFEAIADLKVDLMIWLGDNVYTREVDFGTPRGILYRYWHDRATPELQRLLAAVPQYAIWDDHDYGPNDSDRGYPLKGSSLATFALYWPAPVRGTPSTPGVFQRFSWGDVDFFLLDDRYYRAPNRWPAGPDKPMLGAAQLEWLKDGLVFSNAAFKVVALGNQVLNPANPAEGMTHYPAEQAELLDWIKDQRIDGVLFISGDRHHSELVRLERQGSYPLYDFTSSALTSSPHVIPRDDPEFANPNRIAGTLLEEHSFGVLRFEGPASDRSVVLRAFDRTGRLKWERAVSRKEISFAKTPPSS